MLLATALDEDAVPRLDWLGVPALYLVYDWSDLDLVAWASRTGKPLVMQVGTANYGVRREALQPPGQCRAAGTKPGN